MMQERTNIQCLEGLKYEQFQGLCVINHSAVLLFYLTAYKVSA